MKVFYKDVDLRSRKEMINFLSEHYRYNTMSSWNNSTSYANNVKIYNLGLEKEIEDGLWEMLDVEDNYQLRDEVDFLISEFENETGYTAGFNGRSGGYLVMYEMELIPSKYRSYCTRCGQKNYKTTEETGDNICGRCKCNSRVNFNKIPKEKKVYAGRNIDMYEDFEDKDCWDISSLKQRVKLVQAFDKLTDDIVNVYVDAVKDFDISEEVVYTPKIIKVLKRKEC